MDIKELKRFHESSVYYPDEESVSETSLDDIDESKLNKFLFANYGKKADEFDIPKERVLENLKIMKPNGKLSLAGLLFFGSEPQRYRPAFMVKAVSFFGNDMGGLDYRDSKDFVGTIPELFDYSLVFLKTNLHARQSGQNFNSVGKLEISEIALEEILQNAFVHRDYIKPAPIRILIFDNRVEIISPGCLPGGMTEEDLRFGNTFLRNPLMATFCAKTMVYRGLGTGILRALREGAKMSFENSESGNQFKVVIRRPEEEVPEGYGYASVSEPFSSYAGREEEKERLRDKLMKKCPELKKRELENAVRVMHLCAEAHTIPEMMKATGYESRTSFRRNIFTPLLNAGAIKSIIKDNPNSPKQKYVVSSEF